MSTVYDFSARTNDGKELSLAHYRGKPLLIVNVASRCGFTPQYKELQSLYEEFQPQGLEILAFPCNQFGMQEPGSDAEIKSFCELNYPITFPLFSKIDVNGAKAHPLFEFLKSEARGLLLTRKIKWNFTKFLVDRQGRAVKRYAPSTSPKKLLPDIQHLL